MAQVKKIILMCIALLLLVEYNRQKQKLAQKKARMLVTPYIAGQRSNEGQVQPTVSTNTKYLSYQPSGGGWNNQRYALENAIIFAKLLNRTLIVHPIAPHDEILRVKKKLNLQALAYNYLKREVLIPISRVVDLDKLRELVPVVEETGSQESFYAKYRDVSWRMVCHNGMIGFWVDNLPSLFDTKLWTLLKYRTEVKSPIILPMYHRICPGDIKQFNRNPSRYLFWGIKNELLKANEEIIYFSEGSMFARHIYFIDKEQANEARRWIDGNFIYSRIVRRTVARIVQYINRTYVAMHVRRANHPTSKAYTQKFWLGLLRDKKAMSRSNVLYIATDETDLTWFKPFRDAGFSLIFGKDIKHFINFSGLDSSGHKDYIALHEQLICSKAEIFVGSFYSTFSSFITRLRNRGSKITQPVINKAYTSHWIGENILGGGRRR